MLVLEHLRLGQGNLPGVHVGGAQVLGVRGSCSAPNGACRGIHPWVPGRLTAALVFSWLPGVRHRLPGDSVALYSAQYSFPAVTQQTHHRPQFPAHSWQGPWAW